MIEHTIYKYPLDVQKVQRIKMPSDSEILCVQMQNGKPCLWVSCSPMLEMLYRVINMTGTGHDLSNRVMGKYIGTFQMSEGELVFHVFDGGETL